MGQQTFKPALQQHSPEVNTCRPHNRRARADPGTPTPLPPDTETIHTVVSGHPGRGQTHPGEDKQLLDSSASTQKPLCFHLRRVGTRERGLDIQPAQAAIRRQQLVLRN